jgi:aryl-alcohol dehydrogenase-like predicted oxidoreductase
MMEKRRLGRTGHLSTVAIFGGAAFWDVTQAQADIAMEQVIASGVNHIDVAPSYGDAELHLAPWMEKERARFFLGCKTLERTRDGATAELHRSLERLRVNSFDLYQIHAITKQEELDSATGKGGALDAIRDARDAGLVRHIGITGHGLEAPWLFLEALHRFDFDSVLYPINPRLYADLNYRRESQELLGECRARDVGTMIIKAVGRGPWGERAKTYTTWYEPFADAADIQQAVNFALSQDVTALCTAGDTSILPLFLKGCEQFTPMSPDQQEALVTTEAGLEPIFL